MPRPTYTVKLHSVNQDMGKHWHLDMTVQEAHIASDAPAGTRGYSSPVLSIDFVNKVAVTRNSIYQWE